MALLENELKQFIKLHPYLAHVILRATQLRYACLVYEFDFFSITFQGRQVNLTEYCLAYDLQQHQDWARLTDMLLVPELGRSDFIKKALECGAVLTLVTYTIQQEKLGRGHTIQPEVVVCRLKLTCGFPARTFDFSMRT